jgi:hypothetical protein
VRPGLSKSEPTNKVELLKQPIFGNPLITNLESKSLGFSGKKEGNAFASSGCSRVSDLLDPEEQDWKNLSTFELNYHPSNR